MAEQQLLIRSARAAEIAGRIAERERRTVDEIVEAALERYDDRENRATTDLSPQESAADFYARLRAMSEGDDVDLMEIIRKQRGPARIVEL